MTASIALLRIIIAATIIASFAESFASVEGHAVLLPPSPASTAATTKTSLGAIFANPLAGEKDGEKLKKKRKKKGSKSSNIPHVESIPEYKELVVDEKEQITVVRFYAEYCMSCRRSQPLFYKLASDFKDHPVQFVEVPLNKDTKVLHDALEVPSLPWTHIYHPDAGLVEERKVSRQYIDEVRKCLRCYVYGECDLENDAYDCMNVYGECAIEDDNV
ncbi:hypothetical protein ACHAWF_004265 [Thalassiosira exigua]